MTRAPVRIVLFGMPDAGKSSLLGALAQAARLQEPVLNGRLDDTSQGLAELQRRLYEGSPQQTTKEIVPIPVTYESFAQSAPGRMQAVLIDCDGRIANDLVNRRRQLGAKGHGPLGEALLHADAVVLALDASAGEMQVRAELGEFVTFLHGLENSRGYRTDVGGLPVFLVLTKCDLLAQPHDELTLWIERIEERKREVGQQFQDFLARDGARRALPFGRIDLHPWATAVKRPALDNNPPRPQEPFGVAELFRQCFEQARIYRERQQRSGRRLLGTFAATTGVLIVLGGLVATLFITRPGERVTALDLQVGRFESRHQQLSPRGRHQNANVKIDELTRFEKDPAFADLAPERQAYVRSRLHELLAYQKFEQQLGEITDPKDIHQERQLQDVRLRLSALVVPAEHEAEWRSTAAVQRRQEWLDDVAALAAAVQNTRSDYQKLTYEGKQVLQAANEANLPTRARGVLEQAQRLPDPKKDQDRLISGSQRVTYRTVFGIAGVEAVHRQWETIRKDLEPFAHRAEKQ